MCDMLMKRDMMFVFIPGIVLHFSGNISGGDRKMKIEIYFPLSSPVLLLDTCVFSLSLSYCGILGTQEVV